jgi:hypothetical protein
MLMPRRAAIGKAFRQLNVKCKIKKKNGAGLLHPPTSNFSRAKITGTWRLCQAHFLP